MALGTAPVAVQAAQYRTDGKRLFFVLSVGNVTSLVENCGDPESRAEEIPTQQLLAMEVVRHGKN